MNRCIGLLALLFVMVAVRVAASEGLTKFVRKSAEYRDALANGAIASVRLLVTDDNGSPVSNAFVRASFDMTTFEEKDSQVTDVCGQCIVGGRTRGNTITIIVTKEGYYSSRKQMCLIGLEHAHAVKDGRWLPFPIDEKICLRKVMPAARLIDFGEVLVAPVTNSWFGFDLIDRAYSVPYGVGRRSDVEFKVEWDGLPPARSKQCRLLLRFPEEQDGGYYAIISVESSFPYSRCARARFPMLISNFVVVNRNGDPHTTKIPFRKDSEFVFRARSTVDAEKKPISANYGSIRGLELSPCWAGNPVMRFVYVLNPNPNDLNLENADLVRRSRGGL